MKSVLICVNPRLKKTGTPGALVVACLMIVIICASARELHAQTPAEPAERHFYKIDLKIDFDHLTYTGTERVRWINYGEKPTSIIYFHLYPNLRVGDQQFPATPTAADVDEPRLDVVEVRAGVDDSPLFSSIDDQGTTLRVNLREQVAPEAAAEVVIKFKGSVPEIDRDETSLTTHVVKQVSAALRSDRETRRARDINFSCRSVMLLGAAYPVLAVHDGDEWRRKLEPSVGDFVFNEAADYEVTVATNSGVEVFTSGTETGARSEKTGQTFTAPAMRDFAILAGRGLHSEHTEVQGIDVRSIYLSEHERVGKRALVVAANALRVFTSLFGPLPFKTISVAEAPLVAGLGSCEFSGFNIIASAFYVDFDSPSVRNLPEIIREQRPSVEESLEWAVAHLVAHQWWGAAVGNDPAREPLLDEALSSWSALLYYRSTYGDEKATAVLDNQVRGVYRLYRTFGGDDMDANRPSRDYRNTFQYAAIVSAKGALMFVDLQKTLGEEKIFAALRNYYQANQYEIAQLEDLRIALVAEAPVEQRRMIGRTFTRWLTAKRGDEDIAPPDQELAASLGIPAKQTPQKSGDKNAFGALAKVGKFFWQQVTRIR
ncbi:MAG TPA: M1 family aminopeptidase [Pyrinomonadaceae bacterium]|nr:M1 family aminopeptidase [Pyrinomonadaceae bacterium]